MAGGVNVVEIVVKADNQTQAGFAEAKAGAEGAAGGMDAYAAAADRAAKAEQDFRAAQAEAEAAQAHLGDLQRSGTASADELAAAQDRVTEATLRSLDAQRALITADAEVAEAEAKAGDAAVAQGAKTRESAAESASGFTRFRDIAGLGLAAVGYESVKMAMSFQKAMELLVTQAGVPQAHLAALKADVLNLAGAVGFSPDSLAVSLYHVASNMQSMGATSAQMMKVVQVAAEGAKTGNANLEDVTNALTAAIASGIPGVQNYSQAMGALNAIVGAGDMKMQDLAEAFGSGMVATVKGFGLSLTDVGAALAVFGDNNIRASHAGTQLRMSVMALAVPAAAGKKLLEGMGMGMTTLAADMRKGGLLKALEDLQEHFKKAGITAKEQGDVITQIFGKKAGAGLNVLMDQMDRLKSKYPDIEKGASDFGKAWGDTQHTLSEKLDQLRGSFDALMIRIGSGLIPVVSALAGFLHRNAGALSDLAMVAIPLVGMFLGFAGAMKLAEIGMEAWATVTKLAAAAQWLLNAALDANPIMLVVIAIAGLVAGVVLAYEHFKAFRDVVKDAWNDIRAATAAVWEWMEGFISGAVSGVKAVLHWFAQLGSLFRGWWDDAVNAVRSVTGSLLSFAAGIPGKILHALGDLGHLLWDAGKSVIEGLIGGVESMIGDVRNVIGGIGHDISSAFGAVLHIFSPSKVFEEHGRMIAAGLVQGMDGSRGLVAAAARRLAGSTLPGSGGGYGAGGTAAAPVVVQIVPGGGAGGLEQQFWAWLKNGVRAQGGDPRMFNRKVAFQGER